MSILVIDDSAAHRKVLEHFLKQGGHTSVVLSASVQQAFNYLKMDVPNHQSQVDLILLDTLMPDMSGIEVCRLIRSTEHLKDIPVIMMTDAYGQKYLKIAFAVGAQDFIIKPVKEVELLARVGSLLRLKQEMDARKNREKELLELTQKLKATKKHVEEANWRLMESIHYAEMIQRSMLPNLGIARTYIPNSFFVWIPRDVVSGDIYYTDSFRGGFIIAVIDCTGHGVPGALMTMIASSGLKRIIKDEHCYDPATILKRLNFFVKTSLQQDTSYALSDDGLDAAMCVIHLRERSLTFSGARIPLIYIQNNEVNIFKGDRQSVGYKRCDLNYDYTNHTTSIDLKMSFYIASDGLTDQLGGPKSQSFGTSRLKEFLKENHHKPFEEQKKLLIQTFDRYRGNIARVDDITVVGFGF